MKPRCFCVMAERSHGKKSNRLSNPMGYEEVHIEYSTAQLLPTFPRGTPSDQPSVDSAADATPRRRAAQRAAAVAPRCVKTIAPLHSLREVGKPYSTVYKVYLTHWLERIVLYLILESHTVADLESVTVKNFVTGNRESSDSTVFRTQKKTY